MVARSAESDGTKQTSIRLGTEAKAPSRPAYLEQGSEGKLRQRSEATEPQSRADLVFRKEPSNQRQPGYQDGCVIGSSKYGSG